MNAYPAWRAMLDTWLDIAQMVEPHNLSGQRTAQRAWSSVPLPLASLLLGNFRGVFLAVGKSEQEDSSHLGLLFEALRIRAHVRFLAGGRRNLLLRNVLLRVAHPKRWRLAAELVEGACLH